MKLMHNSVYAFIKNNFKITYRKKDIEIPADWFCSFIGEKDKEGTEDLLVKYIQEKLS